MKKTDRTKLQRLQSNIIRCKRCPRLVAWRMKVAEEKVARFADQKYWGKPNPGFGDPDARLLLVGLAPAAHGGNRTGRMFTGDRSGDWLYRALHKSGFANQPTSISREDELQLNDCYVTATARCAPPQNELLPEEIRNCRPYLQKEIRLLKNVRVIIALGKVGWDAAFDSFRMLETTPPRKRPAFGHGREHVLNDSQTLIASYHPSQQNTFTGKLTEEMFDAIFRRAKSLINSKVHRRNPFGKNEK